MRSILVSDDNMLKKVGYRAMLTIEPSAALEKGRNASPQAGTDAGRVIVDHCLDGCVTSVRNRGHEQKPGSGGNGTKQLHCGASQWMYEKRRDHGSKQPAGNDFGNGVGIVEDAGKCRQHPDQHSRHGTQPHSAAGTSPEES